MDLKTIILVVILAIFLGIALFFGMSFVNGRPISLATTAFAGINEKTEVVNTPTETPKPTLAPLPQGVDLKNEVQKIEIPDFADDYQILRSQINNP